MAAMQLFGLLQGAQQSGLLALLRTPALTAELAAATGIAEERVIDICRALDAHAVVIQTEGRYHLADPWRCLTAPDAPQALEDQLAFSFTQMKILANAATGDEDYWTLPPADRLAIAKGSPLNPASPQAPAIIEMWFRTLLPELHSCCSAGGRYLYLGCGASGTLLSYLQAYPKLTAVGVELAGELLAVARQRALDLGVSDRVCFHEGDARDYHAPAQFDVVDWSQTYFPTASRADALSVAFQSLKPGGLFTTVLHRQESETASDNLHTDEGRAVSLTLIEMNRLGFPAVNTATILQEISAAGFIEMKLVATAMHRRLLARRPA